MTRTVSSGQARAHLAELVNSARYRGDATIIEKNGKAAAALVPVEMFKRMMEARGKLVDDFRGIRESVRTGLSAEQVETLIDREIVAVRTRRARAATSNLVGSKSSSRRKHPRKRRLSR